MRKQQWPYNPGMAPAVGGSSKEPPDARHVVDAIPGLAWSSRPDGSVEFFNGRWYEYTGLSPEESRAGAGRLRFMPKMSLDCSIGGQQAMQKVGASAKYACGVPMAIFNGSCSGREPLFDQTGAVVRWFGTWHQH